MTRDKAIQEACTIFALVYHSIGDYSHPADGFCDKCPAGRPGTTWSYQNAGKVFAYVRKAVVAALNRDGYKLARGFNSDGTEKA